jgi:hypothetical protein
VDRYFLMGLVLLLLVVLLSLMLLGWRSRQRKQSNIAQPEGVPEFLGATRGSFDGFYVATTAANDPLNRIAVRGLGYRARATVTVADAGIVLSLRGESDAFIALASLREVTRATWTIDRVVEEGGLVLIGWQLGDTPVDSYFRLEEPSALLDAINHIFPVTTGRKA